jgi:hypothetical protein
LADFLLEVNVTGGFFLRLRLLIFLREHVFGREGFILLFLALLLLRNTDQFLDLILLFDLIISVLVLVEHLVHLIKHLLI